MPKKPYISFNWHKLSEPLVPTIWLRFRGSNSVLCFPDKTNKIYIENAEFNVLDDNGVSSATITLADPDFINLERFFMVALFHANSSARDNLFWYVGVNWGWSFYGQNLYNPNDTDSEAAQYKMSGTHYYMLSNLSYDASDVELRVTLELIDIGNSIFSEKSGKSVIKTVGRVSSNLEAGGTSTSTSFNKIPDEKYLLDTKKETGGVLGEEHRVVLIDPTADNVKKESVSTETKGQALSLNNVFVGKNNWEILKEILLKQQPPIEVVTSTLDGEPKDPYEGIITNPSEVKRIPETAPLKETIENLLNEMPKFPSKEVIDSLKSQGKPIPVTKRWGILPGGHVDPGSSNIKMIFGWIPDPPTKEQEVSIPEDFRLARIYTYVPGTVNEILAGETQILSLSYDWFTQGYWGLGFPTIYGIARNSKGEIVIVANKDDWRAKEAEGYRLISKPPESGEVSLLEAVNSTQGIQVVFNFDTDTESNEKITTEGNNVVINVWNYFLKEMVDVNIEVPGDPFLDNRVFSREGKESDDILNDLLVDLYHSYFVLKVYRTIESGGRTTSPLFEGKYLCLKGCRHRISEGEYTTSLSLFKAF